MQSYSIAEARNKFTAIVHAVETTAAIELTRRGEPVAVLISIDEYKRMKEGQKEFWSAYIDFRQKFNLQTLAIDPDEIYADARNVLVNPEFEW